MSNHSIAVFQKEFILFSFLSRIRVTLYQARVYPNLYRTICEVCKNNYRNEFLITGRLMIERKASVNAIETRHKKREHEVFSSNYPHLRIKDCTFGHLKTLGNMKQTGYLVLSLISILAVSFCSCSDDSPEQKRGITNPS